MILDIYTHILPDAFFREMSRVSPKLQNIGARLRGVKKLFDLDLRFAEMDEIGDYAQVISLPNPPLEEIAQGDTAAQLARVANDAMAELVAKHPKRFPAFVAAVSLDDVDTALKEAERAITTLGARGIQIFTNVAGHPARATDCNAGSTSSARSMWCFRPMRRSGRSPRPLRRWTSLGSVRTRARRS